jgi:hypothetical protein
MDREAELHTGRSLDNPYSRPHVGIARRGDPP